MPGIETIRYYWNLYKLHLKGLSFSKDYQLKLYNWFPPFVPQDLWLSRFVEERGLLKNNPQLKAGVFTINGKQWMIRKQPCDLKIFLARENLAFRKGWHDFMLNEPCIDLSIGFDYITDYPHYLRIPFWMMWALDPMDTYESIKAKVEQWNAPENSSYNDRRFCALVCSHGDDGRRMIFGELSKIGHVDSAGRWLHNDDSLKHCYGDNKAEWLRNYRFNLCPENSNAPGYCTEKLLEAIQCGCIPIYWGSDNKPEPDVFNQDAIIFFEMGKENDEAMKQILELDSDEKMYMDFACQPRFVDGAAEVIWGYYERLENKLKEIINNV